MFFVENILLSPGAIIFDALYYILRYRDDRRCLGHFDIIPNNDHSPANHYLDGRMEGANLFIASPLSVLVRGVRWLGLAGDSTNSFISWINLVKGSAISLYFH